MDSGLSANNDSPRYLSVTGKQQPPKKTSLKHDCLNSTVVDQPHGEKKFKNTFHPAKNLSCLN